MNKLKLIISIAVAIGLFALSTESTEVTKEEATEQIIADLDKIQTELDKNSNDQQVAEKQLKELEKLRDTYQKSDAFGDAFNDPDVLDWYSALEERASKVLQPPPANQSSSVSLEAGEKIGTLEIKFVGQGGQIPVFRITAESEKYAGILEHSLESTTEREMMKLARDSGLKVSGIEGLAGKRVIFKPIEKSRVLTQSRGEYPHARIIKLLND